VNILNKQ